MKPEDLNPEEELEVRITALLLGELTAEEEAEVRAELARNPDLTRLHDRLKAVLGLVKDAVPTTELPADAIPEPLALATERREELLAIFQGGQPKVKEAKIIKVSFWKRHQKDLLKLAAMVMALFGVSWLMVGAKREEDLRGALEGESYPGVFAQCRDSVVRLFSRDSEVEATSPLPPPADAPLTAGSVNEAEAQLVAQTVAANNPYHSDFAVSKTLVTNAVTFSTTIAPIARSSSLSALPDVQRTLSESSATASFYASSAPANQPQVQLTAPSVRFGGELAPPRVTTQSGRSSVLDFTPQAQTVGGVVAGVPMEKFEAPPRDRAGEGNYTYRAIIPSATPQIDKIHNYAKSLVLNDEMSAGVAQQNGVQNLRIALPTPEAEVAQTKELSDNYFGGNGQNQGMSPATRFGRGVQVAQGINGPAAGAAGIHNWGYKDSKEYDSAASLFDAAARNAIPDASGNQPMLHMFSAGNDGGQGVTRDINGGARSVDTSFGHGGKDQVQDLGNLPTAGRLFANGTDALAMGDRLSRVDMPARPLTATAAPNEDAWRQPRQAYLSSVDGTQAKPASGPEIVEKLPSIKSNMDFDTRDGAAMASVRLRGVDGEKAASDPAGQPSDASGDITISVARDTYPTGSITLNYATLPTDSAAKSSGKVQHFSFYDSSADAPAQPEQENRLMERNAPVVLPPITRLQGSILSVPIDRLTAKKDWPSDAQVEQGKPAVMAPPGPNDAFLTGGLRQNIGVGGQQSALAANGPAAALGIEAKAKQSGKPVDSDADFLADNEEKKPAQKMDGFNLDVVDLTISQPVPEQAMTVGQPAPVLSFDLKPEVEEAAKRQALSTVPENERTHLNYDDRIPNVAQKLRKSGEVMLGERLELESVSEATSKELADQKAGAKGNKAEVSQLVQDAKLLRELRRSDEAEAKLKEAIAKDPQNAAAQYYMNLVREDQFGDLARKRGHEFRQRIIVTNGSSQTVPTLTGAPAQARLAEKEMAMLPKEPSLEDVRAKAQVAAKKEVEAKAVELLAKQKKVAVEEPPAKPKTPTPPGIPQPEVSTAQNAFSTFSLNVSDVSYKLAAASLEKGVMPEVGSVRTEEFINAFNYHDPEPTGNARIAFAWERARYPFAHDRDLVRFSVQTAAIGREPGKPLNIVLLLDNSGSMERSDRLRIRQECLRVLASQLQPQDKVSVVSFARTARLWVDGLTGAQIKDLPARVGNLTPEGGTNLEEAMNLAYQTAQNHYSPQGVNRVVLLTDGAANLGDVEPESLKKKVVEYRKQGVALDCFGIGWEGYNDDLLEALSRNGDGRYGFVNSPEAATTEFASQLAGALKVAASDVKVQVEWNPKRVTIFRQLGYAKHQLKKEEFRDNKVDAAEIGAAEAGNALYTVQVNPAGEGPLGVVRVRYRLPNTDDYREQEWPLAYDGASKSMEQSSVPMRLAATASAFSEWLVTSPYAGEVTSDALINQMAGVPEAFPADPRPKQLEWMIRQAKSLSGR